MARKKTNGTSKRQNKPVRQKSGLIKEQIEDFNHRMLAIFCIAGVIGTLLFLAFFFSSDIRNKIIAAKTTSVYATHSSTSDHTNLSGVSDSTLDFTSVLNDPDVSREDAVDYLSRMSDEDFQTFINTFTEKTEQRDIETSGLTSELHDLLLQSEHKKLDIIAYLKQMDAVEFNTLVNTFLTTVRPNSKQQSSVMSDKTESSLQGSLEDAYAEAERLYPGQINGSTRLKLVEDLNATDYMYYVAEEGDTLIKLSRAFNVSLGQLVELNGIHDADFIPAGMILLFPSDTEQPDISE
ncbi:LysM peptidoglycan-binding domain-containing protein [Virgibacillus sp. AGTR]|uniref:LysM peptidoglycan-binding domain-containing protein n=1 Tax=Virgibacillus sp. AGTR TaxID=2812055 RepID=UPI001D1672F5|nr:LysM peptidoglycan-binding domain-containing protein [Virgibacillus sp. AGTR]MCC2248937.1 LysM peptidoglycan-binding domain-containing protein [Virgibacillus sp. AGTR]